MQGINKVIVIGHLGKDPEMTTAGTFKVANCSIATSERYKDKTTGETKTITEWHRVVFFNRLAEIAGDFLKKGSAVYIEGKLKTEKYTDKQGVERYTTKIIANNLQMLGGKTNDDVPNNNNSSAKAASNNNSSTDAQYFNDEIPF
jgi:single-strand DNA-binding protein